MKTLSSLVRLHRVALDERRRELVALESRRARLESEREAMEEELRAEQRVAASSLEAWRDYAGFAQAAIRRRAIFARSLAALDTEIAQAVAAVGAAYQEVKRYEVALDAHRKRQRAERERREQAALDEVAIDRHRRRAQERA